jgi:hypothetical protein
MQEVRYCGQMGEVEDRQPVLEGDEKALRCPHCGHLDHLSWLPEDARPAVFQEAARRSARRGSPAAA